MIVVDLGCFPHRHEVSIEALVKRYRPKFYTDSTLGPS